MVNWSGRVEQNLGGHSKADDEGDRKKIKVKAREGMGLS